MENKCIYEIYDKYSYTVHLCTVRYNKYLQIECKIFENQDHTFVTHIEKICKTDQWFDDYDNKCINKEEAKEASEFERLVYSGIGCIQSWVSSDDNNLLAVLDSDHFPTGYEIIKGIVNTVNELFEFEF